MVRQRRALRRLSHLGRTLQAFPRQPGTAVLRLRGAARCLQAEGDCGREGGGRRAWEGERAKLGQERRTEGARRGRARLRGPRAPQEVGTCLRTGVAFGARLWRRAPRAEVVEVT